MIKSKDISTLVDSVFGLGEPTFPRYDQTVLADGTTLLRLALAGYQHKELDMTLEGDRLTISSGSASALNVPEDALVLHSGIASRPFKIAFRLPLHTKVTRADYNDGLLVIEIKRVVPEEAKPKKLTIGVPLG